MDIRENDRKKEEDPLARKGRFYNYLINNIICVSELYTLT